jgi:hypothetical protein
MSEIIIVGKREKLSMPLGLRREAATMFNRTLVIILTGVLLALGMTAIVAAYSSPAKSLGTNCVWLTAEAQGERPAGQKECESWSGVTRISAGNFTDACTAGNRVVLRDFHAWYCQSSQLVYTTNEPPITVGASGSKARAIADSMKQKAAAHGLALQFARVDGLNRSGCPSSHPTWLASATWASDFYGGRPGYGLIRVSAGPDPESCLRYWVKGWDTAYHEAAHQLIARHCNGDMDPPIAGGRGEPVTGAYAHMYLGSSADTHTAQDEWAARKIRYGVCE